MLGDSVEISRTCKNVYIEPTKCFYCAWDVSARYFLDNDDNDDDDDDDEDEEESSISQNAFA